MMGPQIINSYFVTAESLIEQNPELGFVSSDLSLVLVEVFTQSFII